MTRPGRAYIIAYTNPKVSCTDCGLSTPPLLRGDPLRSDSHAVLPGPAAPPPVPAAPGAVFLQMLRLLRLDENATFTKPIDPSLFLNRFVDRLRLPTQELKQVRARVGQQRAPELQQTAVLPSSKLVKRRPRAGTHGLVWWCAPVCLEPTA